MALDAKDMLAFHTAAPIEKQSKEYGSKIAKFIEKIIKSDYFDRRNMRFEKNRRFARGRQPMQEFLDLLNVDGKAAFSNIDMKAPAIAPKFMQILTQRFIYRDEKPICTAVDHISTERKRYEKNEAKFRMTKAPFLQELENQSGIPVVDKSKFTPADDDELELFFGLEYKMPEEILFEKGIDYVLKSNGITNIKRKVLQDLVEVGIGAMKVDVGAGGRVKLRRVIPENLIYSHCEYDDFRDIAFIGEIVKMRITDIREAYPNIDEQTLCRIAQTSTDAPTSVYWNDQYRNAPSRPYDDYSVSVVDFELKTIDALVYQEKTNKYGNIIVESRNKAEQGKSYITPQMAFIYKGCFVVGSRGQTGELLSWARSKNAIRPSDPKDVGTVFFSYSAYMYDNLDMVNMSVIERAETSIRQMTLIHLKIQQLVAKMRPSGLIIDVEGLKNVDIGGGKTLEPMQIQSVYDQTGNLYYSSLGVDGERSPERPIQEMPNNGSINQLSQLIETYNFYLNSLRNEIGTNEYSEGASVNPKMGLGVLQNQVQMSNNATEFIYEGWITILQDTVKKISLLLYDSVTYGGDAYRSYLGKDDVKDKIFDIFIEMLPDDEARRQKEAMIQTAMSAGIIEFEDAFKIKNIKNIKLAEVYLSRAKKKKQQDDMMIAQQNSQMQAQSAIQASQVAQDGQAQLKQMEAQLVAAKIKQEWDSKEELSLQEFVQTALLESFKMGKELPNNIQTLIDGFFSNKQMEHQQQQQVYQEETIAKAMEENPDLAQQMQGSELEAQGMADMEREIAAVEDNYLEEDDRDTPTEE